MDEGVGRLPRSADLLLMKGTLLELIARSETADFRGTWSVTSGINRMASPTVARIEDTLGAAANVYERALQLDPSITSARLRLGWVYGINHSNAHAREQLRLVANGRSSRELRYLAHLFLGGLADVEGNFEGAYDEYEAAHATHPDAQSASIALMRAARLTGRTDLEQELLARYPARTRTGEDPWWYFSLGFDIDLMAILTQAPTFRSSVDRVQRDVSATRNGRTTAGLTAADFIVVDNGSVQEIESIGLEELLLRVQLVLDASGSVSNEKLRRLIDAGTGLLNALRPSDSAGLITFSTAVDIRVPMTRDRGRVTRALGSVQGAGATSLRDAVQLALAIPPAADARTVVIVFSDGADTSSWLRDAEVVESARRSGIVVHVVAVRAATVASRFIPSVTEAAGGRVFSASSEDDLGRLFTSALADTWLARAEGERPQGWHRREGTFGLLRTHTEVARTCRATLPSSAG